MRSGVAVLCMLAVGILAYNQGKRDGYILGACETAKVFIDAKEKEKQQEQKEKVDGGVQE